MVEFLDQGIVQIGMNLENTHVGKLDDCEILVKSMSDG